MIHSNITLAINILEELALKEIASAIRAHNGVYLFNKNNNVTIVGKFAHAENSEDISLTRIMIENDKLNFFGLPAHYMVEEQQIKDIEPAYYGHVLDRICPSEHVKGVRDMEDIFKAVDYLRNVLLR